MNMQNLVGEKQKDRFGIHAFVEDRRSGGKCKCGGMDCPHPQWDCNNEESHWCIWCGVNENHTWTDAFNEDDAGCKCSRCEYETVKHSYSNGVCSRCGHQCSHYNEETGEECSYCNLIVPGN